MKGNLHEKYKHIFKDTFWIIASNRVPSWSKPSTFNTLYEDHWEPLMSRVNWTELTDEFDGKHKGQYGDLPYNAAILAKAILEKYN